MGALQVLGGLGPLLDPPVLPSTRSPKGQSGLRRHSTPGGGRGAGSRTCRAGSRPGSGFLGRMAGHSTEAASSGCPAGVRGSDPPARGPRCSCRLPRAGGGGKPPPRLRAPLAGPWAEHLSPGTPHGGRAGAGAEGRRKGAGGARGGSEGARRARDGHASCRAARTGAGSPRSSRVLAASERGQVRGGR
ncbi:unnamed protein product [Rangifer tarandus platyrhynchus]|uniref:Uncharacterized protein n=1 Tax=Rangifer tarandus platyrhynchus TaxID=3082113 RepID=A0ABN8YTQ4_RANTA|nr:unnamed protein product [Rangifer tarandus platyrhynchus]